ncbi:MAG TPA: tRNA (adenine-N1)-methyltransferase [Anaerolineales bacterium]
MSSRSTLVQDGDLVQLVGQDHKNFIFRLYKGEQLQTHRGTLNHDDLIGLSWGSRVYSHMGKPFYLLQPSIHDLLLDTRRNTQIMYPKDIGFILLNLDIGPGKHVVEAGTGSGAFTTALAYAVGSEGHVASYEVRPEMAALARRNLERVGLVDRVTFKIKDIEQGFDESEADSLFLDVINPEAYIGQSKAALKPGGVFGCILPTVNQLSRVIPALKKREFAFIEVCEIFLRYYKTIPQRIRPTDRMVAHTGYLVFARSILTPDAGDNQYDQDTDLIVEDAEQDL